ncbi:hypothetical protein EV182_001856, partial [Spiromyces aspiralis]
SVADAGDCVAVSVFGGVPVCSLAVVGRGVLVGGARGQLVLLGHSLASGRKEVLAKFPTLAAKQRILSISVCPHNPDVFACATSDHTVATKVDGSHLLFQHFGHRSPVTEVMWHPDPQYKYVIGSTELGNERRAGRLQVWKFNELVVEDGESLLPAAEEGGPSARGGDSSA